MQRCALMSGEDLRLFALDPELFAPCCDYARQFYPRFGLGRAA
jgi:hypothetical protein